MSSTYGKHLTVKAVIVELLGGEMRRYWLLGVFLITCCTTTVVHSSHFRGAVIMVRPKFGGADKEVL